MNCPKCGKPLPEKLNMKMDFCPQCGERLFEVGRRYLVQIKSNIARDSEVAKMLVFVDDRDLYEIKPMETICIALNAGFHTFYFRHKIRNKDITLLISSNYVIAANYNSLSGLIETNIMMVEDTADGVVDKDLDGIEITEPIMVSKDGIRSFNMLTGNDDPIYEIRATSGLKEGILRLYENRLEFSSVQDMKKDGVYYTNVVAVRPKMGSVDVQCAGNVHKVYSIPKDNYNEVIAFLTNRIGG